MVTVKQEIKKLKKAEESLFTDNLLSAFYFGSKCVSTVGGVYCGVHTLTELAEGKYWSAVAQFAASAGCFKLYKIFDRNCEAVDKRIKKTESYLEDRMRESYGK